MGGVADHDGVMVADARKGQYRLNKKQGSWW
jgi:hypothetical protein